MKRILVTHAVKEEYIPLKMEGYEIEQIYTGIGKTKSAHILTKKIYENKPDFILNIGTAGTLSHNIGDVFIVTHFIDRDYETIKLPGVEYEMNGLELIGKNPGLKKYITEYGKQGICSTGDSFVTEIADLSGDIVDMEAYAQAYVCKELNIPFLSIKYITDVIGKNSVEHWENKLADARTTLTGWFKENNLLSVITNRIA